ncbi:isochorismatase family protein [Methanosarcina sp. T3]|uniref:isochorismatase family protein n=1 Tax=Methanosarcina sp. T3 TaxID=3439062 RepID=UPI003F87D2EC
MHASVRPLAGETVIEKNFPNSFFQTELLSRLKEAGITELVICGAIQPQVSWRFPGRLSLQQDTLRLSRL